MIWTPAGSAWGAVLNDALSAKGQPPMAPTDAKSLMRTPLMIAMPRPMAQALGWPDTPIGYADILALAQDPNGWGAKGHPEWGPFKLGKTNPNFHQRPQRHHRPVLRGHRQDLGPHPGGS